MSTNIRSQLFRVIDVETTGLSPTRDRVVELAWAIIRGDGTILSSNNSLVNPGCPIPPDASRVHGIFDSDVASSPTLDEAVASYPDLWEQALPSVCHNAVFDAAFLRRSPRFAEVNQRFICTMRLAENLIPDCDSYALDSLRVRLGLDVSGKPAAAHRAAADVASTCSLLKHLIDRHLGAGHKDHVDGLLELSTILRMPFGKHKGELLATVPDDYLDWLLGRDIDDELRSALLRARRGPTPS